MGCTACGNKAYRPLSPRGARLEQPSQPTGTGTGSRDAQARSILDRMRYTGKS